MTAASIELQGLDRSNEKRCVKVPQRRKKIHRCTWDSISGFI